jgi:transcriptional regulator with XRE-family HTH domain
MTKRAEAVPDAFRRQMRFLRKERGWTQQDLSDRLASLGWDVDRTALLRIEKGEREVALAEALLISAALNVPPVWLFLPIEDGVKARLAPDAPSRTVEELREWFVGRADYWGPEEDDMSFGKTMPRRDPALAHAHVMEEIGRRTAELKQLVEDLKRLEGRA